MKELAQLKQRGMETQQSVSSTTSSHPIQANSNSGNLRPQSPRRRLPLSPHTNTTRASPNPTHRYCLSSSPSLSRRSPQQPLLSTPVQDLLNNLNRPTQLPYTPLRDRDLNKKIPDKYLPPDRGYLNIERQELRVKLQGSTSKSRRLLDIQDQATVLTPERSRKGPYLPLTPKLHTDR